jgi:hypothetical protein
VAFFRAVQVKPVEGSSAGGNSVTDNSGGAGTANSITGSSVGRCGGGGSGATSGTGGTASDGGGAGGTAQVQNGYKRVKQIVFAVAVAVQV